MLGRDLVAAARYTNHEVTAVDRGALDVTDATAVASRFADERPAAVVNCAAYTDVDGAEDERQSVALVNADGAHNVAQAAAAVGAAVVYPSTDYVFDGTKTMPYVESDPTAPQSVYGASKLAGERRTAAVNPRHYVVRTAWLFGAHGRNFVATMLGLAETESQVLVVRDQIGAPTYTGHLATGLVRLLDTDAYGLHHMTAGGQCSWYDFAVEIFRRAEIDCTVLSTTSEELARPAPRPAYSVLASEWPYAVPLPEWRSGLDSYLRERATG